MQGRNYENWDPLKKHEEKIKTLMGNSTGNTDKKNLRRQAKMIKQRKDARTRRDFTYILDMICKHFVGKHS